MQFPILKSLLGNEVLQQMINTWPDKYFYAHGELERLPKPLLNDILRSIASLTEAYAGHLNEIDPRKGYEMYPVADGTATEVIKRGATAYLDDVSPLLSDVQPFIKGLEQELNITRDSVKLGVFISSAGSGAPTHYDVLDVISIQLVGTKKFHVSPLKQIRYPYGMQYVEGTTPFDELYPQITQGFPSSEEQEFEQINMLPGSVLFMPRGVWHYTEAEQDSMAMCIVLSPPTQLDFFLYQLKSTLLQDHAWRSPCYGLGGKEAVNSKLYSKLSNTIYKLAKAHQSQNSPIRSFHKDSRYLVNPDVEIQIEPGTVFNVVEYQAVSVEGQKNRVRMEVSDQITDIFRWLSRKNKPFTVGECMKQFPEIPKENIGEFFSRSSQTGYLKPLWFIEL